MRDIKYHYDVTVYYTDSNGNEDEFSYILHYLGDENTDLSDIAFYVAHEEYFYDIDDINRYEIEIDEVHIYNLDGDFLAAYEV